MKRRPVPGKVLAARLADEAMEVYGLVHWGLNTFTDREWGYGDEDPALLNPAHFDADQIVGACREAGLAGLIVVAKHHDGFCLWPTKTTGHNISKSPFRGGKGDYVREMAEACRRAGLKFGVYVSPWDRNNAHYGTPEYVELYHRQIRELLGGDYGEIFEMWFDGANGGDGYYGGARESRKIPQGYYRFDEVFKFVRELQPGVCIFNEDDRADFRWPGNEEGIMEPDARATVPHFDPANYAPYMGWCNDGTHEGDVFHPAEADFPQRRGWFYHPAQDGNSKSGEYLMKSYLRTVGNGATMNLGIVPNKDGVLTDEDVAKLRRFGELRRIFFSREVADGEPFNVVVMKEDLSCGEQVDGWEFLADGRKILEGTSIGLKRIRVLDEPLSAARCELRVTRHAGDLQGVAFRRYFVDPALLKSVVEANAPGGETDTAKWMQGFRNLLADVYPVPAGERLYGGYVVTVDGREAPVSAARCSAIPFNRRWPGHQRDVAQTELAGFVRFAFSRRTVVEVTPDHDFEKVVVRPLSKKVRFYRNGRTVGVVLVELGGYTVEFDGHAHALHLFADAPRDYGVAPDAPGVRYYGPGEHDVGAVELKSGETVYIDKGAVVYGRFNIEKASDVAILGGGILDMGRIKEEILFDIATGDGSFDVHNAKRWHAIRCQESNRIRIDGITIRDSLCYNIGLYGCADVEIENVKIIGQWRYNTDGIDFHNCRRGRVRNCFARTYDDTFCCKSHAQWVSDCEDILFEKCVAWCDWGKALEVGVECQSDHLRRLVYRDCDIIHSAGNALDVANVDHGEVSDILFEDIRVEDDDPMPAMQFQKADDAPFDANAGLDAPLSLFVASIWFSPEYSTERGVTYRGAGRINGVVVRDVVVTARKGIRCGLYGFDAAHRVSHVAFENIVVNGKPVRDLAGLGFEGNDFADPPEL